VVAFEKVSLYGVPLVTSRKVDYGKIDPELSRELFIQHALIEGEWRTRHRFWHDNQRRIAEVDEVARKLRRRDVSVDDATLFAFYDQRVAPDVVSTRHFDSWWRRTSREQPDLLDLPRELLLGDAAVEATQQLYPDEWSQGDVTLPLSYRFEPGTATDGVVAEVSVAVLNRVQPEDFGWQVPGLRTELVVELLRSLPKDLRRRLVPLPDTAATVLSRITPSDGTLVAALERELRATTGVTVPREAWHPEELPDHLRMTFRVVGTDGRTLAEGPDLPELQRRLAPEVQATLSRASGIERSGQTAWTFGTVPRSFTMQRQGTTVEGFPALVDQGDSVGLRVLASPADQQAVMWAGTRRLLLLNAGSPIAQVHRRLDNATKLALTTNPHGSVTALLDDAVTSALDELLLAHGGPVWDAEAFADLLRAVRAELVDTLNDILVRAAPILVAAADVTARLSEIDTPALAPAVADMRAQLTGLVHPGFLTAKGARRLDDVARYVEGIRRRLDALARDPARDRERMERVLQVQEAYRRRLGMLPATLRDAAAARRIPWMIEELRIGEFAQALGTAYRVSVQRVLRAIDDLDA
jgi:ATP-dependent helicase HrpA